MNRTVLLNQLYSKYNIKSLSFGAIHDKLGDVYEEYCVSILNNCLYLQDLQRDIIASLEHKILYDILSCYNIDPKNIISISATNTVPHRSTGGNSKTDIIATIGLRNGNIVLPISCKQSTVAKVALAEFDVDTIAAEMQITNPRLIYLLTKHQTDCSAKYFTNEEKRELRNLMEPIAKDFVRWVLTGSPNKNTNNICVPTSIIKFRLKSPQDRYNININNGDFDFVSYKMLLIEEYIDKIIYTSNGKIRSGGFGTGLSWTYATGSKGLKMQFKG